MIYGRAQTRREFDLTTIRYRLDMTQKELAEVLGVTQPYISQVELGNRPISRRIFNRLIDKFGEEVVQ